MAAIDEASTDQHEPVEFLTADDLQGITGQLDHLLTGQTSLESKFDLYTGDVSDKLMNLDNNIKEIRDYLLETEQQEDAAPVAESESIDYTPSALCWAPAAAPSLASRWARATPKKPTAILPCFCWQRSSQIGRASCRERV